MITSITSDRVLKLVSPSSTGDPVTGMNYYRGNADKTISLVQDNDSEHSYIPIGQGSTMFYMDNNETYMYGVTDNLGESEGQSGTWTNI